MISKKTMFGMLQKEWYLPVNCITLRVGAVKDAH